MNSDDPQLIDIIGAREIYRVVGGELIVPDSESEPMRTYYLTGRDVTLEETDD